MLIRYRDRFLRSFHSVEWYLKDGTMSWKEDGGFRTYLGRQPDQVGVKLWSKQGVVGSDCCSCVNQIAAADVGIHERIIVQEG